MWLELQEQERDSYLFRKKCSKNATVFVMKGNDNRVLTNKLNKQSKTNGKVKVK